MFSKPSSSSKGSKRPSHGGSSHSSKGKGSRPPFSSSGPYGGAAHAVSFLFMVNELVITNPATDMWHNQYPPGDTDNYVAEAPSKVMRYQNGIVTEAHGYHWLERQDDYSPRSRDLWRWNPQQNDYMGTVTEYQKFAVFSCNPLLPIVVSRTDPMVETCHNTWFPLQCYHPPNQPGRTQIASEDTELPPQGPGLVRFTAARDPSWIPGLLPPTYNRPGSWSPGPSTGLGGELSIILALMAFSVTPDEHVLNQATSNMFLGNGMTARWQGNAFRDHGRAPRGIPGQAGDDPRGFLSIVFLDPEYPELSTVERLEHFEWNTAIVNG